MKIMQNMIKIVFNRYLIQPIKSVYMGNWLHFVNCNRFFNFIVLFYANHSGNGDDAGYFGLIH